MIYGNPITLGGGGGLSPTDAILRVQAPAGSTVTISKGAVSKSDAGHENADDNTVYDYYFIIHASQFDSVNPWTITGTLGTKVTTSTIIINAAKEYDIALDYHVYLIQNGTVNVAFTISGGSIASGTNYATYNSGGNAGRVAYYPVDVTHKSILSITIYNSTGQSYAPTTTPSIGIATSAPTVDVDTGEISWYAAYKKITTNDSYIQAGTYTVDISAFSGMMYIAMAVCGTRNWSGQLNISNFWLE